MKTIGIEIKWAIYFIVMMLSWMLIEKLSGLHDVHLEQQALTLITQYQSDNLEKKNVTIKGSQCPHCNEEVDSSLLLCWNCSQPYRLVD